MMNSKSPRISALISKRLVLVSTVFAILLLLVLMSPMVAHATTEPAYCSTISGTWDGVSTCTFSGSYGASSGTLEITSATTLDIASGGSIVLSGTASLLVDSGATVDVMNSCSVSVSDGVCVGINLSQAGTSMTNNGAINVEPSLACSASPSFC